LQGEFYVRARRRQYLYTQKGQDPRWLKQMAIVVERGLTISHLVACMEPVVQDSNRGDTGTEDSDDYQPALAEEEDSSEGEAVLIPKIKKLTKKMLKGSVHGVEPGVLPGVAQKKAKASTSKRKADKPLPAGEKTNKKAKQDQEDSDTPILPPSDEPDYTESFEDAEADSIAGADLDRNNDLFYHRRKSVMFLDPETIERPPSGIAQRVFDPAWATELTGMLKKGYKPDMLHVVVAVQLDETDRSKVTISMVEEAEHRYAIGGQHSVAATTALKRSGILGKREDFKTIPCLVVINATKPQLLDIAIRHNKASQTVKKTGICDMMRFYRDVLLNPESHGQTQKTAGPYAVCTWHCIDPRMDTVSFLCYYFVLSCVLPLFLVLITRFFI
jgi:hypothetical protein